MAGQFRSNVWDPVLIFSQILSMQCMYYVCIGVWLAIVDAMVSTHNSIEQLYKYEMLQFKSLHGKLIMAAFVLNALTGALGLWIVVRRTRQCLDFTLTLHLIHLIVCWAYNSQFPSTLSWWLVNTITVILMTVLGEFLCMRTELKAIPMMSGKADL